MTNQSYPKTIDQSEYLPEEIIEVNESVEHQFTDEDIVQYKELYYEFSEYKLNRESIIARIKTLMQMDATPEYIRSSLNNLDFETLGDQGIKTLDQEMENIRYKIAQGWEFRTKQCYGVRYPEIDTVAIYSMQTGEFIKARPMSADERQTKLRLA